MTTQRVTCPACGVSRDPEDRFCGACGAALDGSDGASRRSDALAIDDLLAALQHNTDSRTGDIALGVFYGMLLFSAASAVVWFLYFMATNS